MHVSRTALVGMLGATLCAATALAQQPQSAIAGRVMDRGTGTPLQDAMIVIVGTQRGTRSGPDGRYRIPNLDAGTYNVRVSRLGYTAATRSVTVTTGDVTVDFQLGETAVTIDEVVVSATGTSERKRENGNDVSVIKPGELVSTAATPSLAQALQGQAAGVTIASTTGTPGTASKIRIRGANSVSLSNDPLLIVDGVRVDNSSNSLLLGIGGATTSRIDDINPEDIESIEVLKGPAASALYGTAASNGVIQITTKRGHSGRTTWRTFADYGQSWDPTHYPDNYFVFGHWASGANAGKVYGFPNNITSCTLDARGQGLCVPDSTFVFNPTEHFHVLGTGNQVDYGVSASGGSDASQYFIGGDAQRVQGVVDPSKTHNYSLRSNITAQLRPNLNATFTANYIDRQITLPYNDNNIFGVVPQGLLGKAFNCEPGLSGGAATYCGFYKDTSAISSNGFYSYLPSTYYFMRNNQSAKRFVGGANVTWQPFTWLTGAGQAGLDMNNTFEQAIIPSNVVTYVNQGVTQGSINEYRRQVPTYSLNGSFTATKSLDRWGGIQSSTAFGAQYLNEQSHYTRATGTQLIPGTASLNSATALPGTGEQNQTIITIGGYGRQQLSWRDRLFVTASLRGDENSAFGQNFKLAWYPSASLSWVVTEEPFARDLGIVANGWLSQLRLRTAYGQAGQRPGFRQAETYLNASAVAQGAQEVGGVIIGGTGNLDLAPEVSAEEEVGFDASLFNNKLSLAYTFYHKTTRDALIARTLSPSLGLSIQQYVNLGKVENQGNELSATATALDRKALKVELTVAGSVTSNKLLNLGKGIPSIVFNGGTQRHTEGFPLGAYFNQHYTYADKNNDGIIERNEITLGDTATKAEFIGSPFPTRELSVTPAFTIFQNLRISTMFNYQGNFYVFNNTQEFRCTSSAFRNCYEANSPNAPLEQQAAAIAFTATGSNYGYIQKGDFVKLREASATYTLPARWAGRVNASSLGITFAGHNLQTWTKYKGFDPEINSLQSVNSNTTGYGFIASDFLTQPPYRTWTLRLDLGF
ncbi:MAG: SusC/RagA family TonB-linked outer membrane protein [Gemmatimonadaceae bacterium]